MREDWDNKPLAIEVVEGCAVEIGRLLWQLANFRRLRQIDEYSCTPEWMLHHLIQQETEHRGQIMTIRTQEE